MNERSGEALPLGISIRDTTRQLPYGRQSGSCPWRAGLRDSLVGLRSAFVTCSKNLCCPVPGARDAQPKGPQAGHEIPLVVAIAIDPALARPPFLPPHALEAAVPP